MDTNETRTKITPSEIIAKLSTGMESMTISIVLGYYPWMMIQSKIVEGLGKNVRNIIRNCLAKYKRVGSRSSPPIIVK